MASTTFTSGTTIPSVWLNTINSNTYVYKVNVKDFGAVGDGTTDDIAAFEAAIAALTTKTDAPWYSAKGIVDIPGGVFYLSRTLNIEHQLILRGSSNVGGNGYGATRLKFPTGTTGIRIHSNYTSSNGKDAAGAQIQNLTVTTTRGGAAVEGGKYGIHSATRFTLRGVLVSLFGDCGVYINAIAPSPWSNVTTYALNDVVATSGVAYHSIQNGNLNHPVTDTAWWLPSGISSTGNANNWYIDGCRFAENGFDGFNVEGADVNAGTAVNVDCGSNLRAGIYENSFLGNTYIGCHTNANAVKGYNTINANAYSTFIGCYSEGGETNTINSPSVIIGGILGASGTNTGTAPSMGAGLANILNFRRTDIRPDYGIDFTATTAQSSATNLDRYLEGTWTPTVTNVTLAAGAPSTATAAGYYTVIGNEVHWQIIYTPSNTTTIAFTTNTTTFTLPPYTPTVAGTGLGASIAGVVSLLGLIKTDGLFYPRTIAAVNDTITMSGRYRIAT
jgi:Pectate lyase superfamily protein